MLQEFALERGNGSLQRACGSHRFIAFPVTLNQSFDRAFDAFTQVRDFFNALQQLVVQILREGDTHAKQRCNPDSSP